MIIGNKLGTGTRILVYPGNMDMTCARWDKRAAPETSALRAT